MVAGYDPTKPKTHILYMNAEKGYIDLDYLHDADNAYPQELLGIGEPKSKS